MSFKKLVDAQLLSEKSPKGWEGTVKALKKHGDEVDNPWALAHWMKNQGYKSHKKASGADKESIGEGEDLTQNVVDGVVRHIMTNYPEIIQQHGPDKVKQVAYENTYWLTDDWPEDEGFGGSDSYGPVKSTLEHFGIDHDAELQRRHPRESIRVNHPIHGDGTVEAITETSIEITWDNLEKRVSAPNRIAFADAKYLTRLSEQYSSDPEDVEVGGKDKKDDMKKHSRNKKGKKPVKESINETMVAMGMAAIGGTHRGTETAVAPIDNILRFEDLLEDDDDWNKPWEEDDSSDETTDETTDSGDNPDGNERHELEQDNSEGADYTNVPRPSDSILTNQEDQPAYKADPLATMAGHDAAGSGDEPEGDYGSDLNPTDAPDVPDVRELDGTSDRHNTRNTGADGDDTSEVDAGDYDETKPEDGEDNMKNESLWLSAEDLGIDLTEMENGDSMTGYGEDEGMNEHDMGGGEIAFTREFLDKLLAAVSEQAPDADKVAALCSGLEAAQQEKGDTGLDVSDWESVKSHATSAYEGGGDEMGGDDYEGGDDVEADAEMEAPDDMEADDEAYFESPPNEGGDVRGHGHGAKNPDGENARDDDYGDSASDYKGSANQHEDEGYWNEEDRAKGDGEEAGPEGGEEHEGKTKMMDRKGSYDKETGHKVRGQGRPAGKDMKRRKPQKSRQYEGDGSSGTPVGTGNTSGSGGGGQKDLSAPKKYSGKPVGTGTSGAGGSNANEFGQKPSEDGGSNLLPAVNKGKQLGAANTTFNSDAQSPAPRSSKALAAEGKKNSRKKIDEALCLGMSAIPSVIRGDHSEVPTDADWDDEMKTIRRRAGLANWWKDRD